MFNQKKKRAKINKNITFLHLQFEKPGRRENFDYPQMVKESVTKALADAKIPYNEVKQAVVGYVYGNSTEMP